MERKIKTDQKSSFHYRTARKICPLNYPKPKLRPPQIKFVITSLRELALFNHDPSLFALTIMIHYYRLNCTLVSTCIKIANQYYNVSLVESTPLYSSK